MTDPCDGGVAAPFAGIRPDLRVVATEALAVYLHAPQVHPYGIADTLQLADRSAWWRGDGAAVVGLLDLPGSGAPVLYGVAHDDGATTLRLLTALAPHLPDRFVASGPPALADALAPRFTSCDSSAHLKLHLADPGALPAPDPACVVLDRRDLSAVAAIFAADPSQERFFHPGLLDGGGYVGVRDDRGLAAVAGVHVIVRDRDVTGTGPGRWGVAALGNVVTRPDRRREGLGRTVVATLCHRLLGEVGVIGLNVRTDNHPARELYRGMGFRTSVAFAQGAFASAAPDAA